MEAKQTETAVADLSFECEVAGDAEAESVEDLDYEAAMAPPINWDDLKDWEFDQRIMDQREEMLADLDAWLTGSE